MPAEFSVVPQSGHEEKIAGCRWVARCLQFLCSVIQALSQEPSLYSTRSASSQAVCATIMFSSSNNPQCQREWVKTAFTMLTVNHHSHSYGGPTLCWDLQDHSLLG